MNQHWEQNLATAHGVTRWGSQVSLGALEETGDGLGRRVVVLDGSDVEDKASFLLLCEVAFDLPEWFGRNWDALEECLVDLDAPGGVLVLWSDWAVFAEAEPEEYATALDVFSDAARALALEHRVFAVLLVGEEPAPFAVPLDPLEAIAAGEDGLDLTGDAVGDGAPDEQP